MIKKNELKYLPNKELIVYFLVYVSFLLYSIYEIYLIRDVILTESKYAGFDDGWISNRKRDNIDYEWEILKQFIKRNLVWFVVHATISELTTQFRNELTPIIHTLIGSLFLYESYGLTSLILILIKNVTFYITSKLKFKYLIWICGFLWLIFINIFKSDKYKIQISEFLQLDDDQSFELIIILCWNLLKCISFSLDKITTNDENVQYYNLKHFFGYSLYFPTLFVGPFIIYNRYQNMIMLLDSSGFDFRKRLIDLIINLLSCAFWLFFTDFALHYIYINNLQFNPQLIERINPYCLYGLGYLMGQFFNNKYVVSYGLGIAFMKMNRIDAPNKPKCIGRIHLYSDMWKHFDQGLYEFLFIYIYKNLCDKNSSVIHKFGASFITFTFIYFWHGFYMFVLLWTSLNFICLTIETLSRNFSRTQEYKLIIRKFCSYNNELRINAIIASQLFIQSALSNFYFFAGVEVGHIFIIRTFTSGYINYIVLTICCICIYHTSEFIKRRENLWNSKIK